jgi:hypothetical protein
MKRPSALHVVTPTPPRKRQAAKRIGLMDPDWKYVPAGQTDIRVTFARIRAELAKGKK